MPDMLAHHTVAEAARERLPRGPLARLLGAERDAYKVGAQGPDFLFYSHVWPGQRSRADLAALLHQHKMSEVFRSMLNYAAGLPADRGAIAFSYVCGYSAHLCLDGAAHPWIMFWTGDISEGAAPEAKARARRRHGLLEGSLDVMLRRERSADPGWLREQRLLRMSAAQLEVVTELFEHVFADVHGIVFTAAEARAAFRDMDRVYSAMTDRSSALSRLLTALGPLTDRDGTVRAQIYPDEPLPAAVDLVASRRRWRHPCLPDEPATATFGEIIDTATAETGRCLEAVAAVACGGDIDAAVAAIGDRSMLTGLACDDTRPLVAFAPYRDLIWAAG
jgi:hypothetical protein